MFRKIPSLFFTAALALAACGALEAKMEPTQVETMPDLIVKYMYLEMEGRQGNCVAAYTPYEIRVVVENIGQASAGPFSVELNAAQQGVDKGLAAGQSVVLHFPGTVPSGQYEASVDVADQVVERREDNNSLLFLAPTPTPPPLCASMPVPTP